MNTMPLEGTIVKVTNPSFTKFFSEEQNKWKVIGVGPTAHLDSGDESMVLCKPLSGKQIYQFLKGELEIIE